MEPIFIDDGMTREGFVPASPRLHGALRFTYRPALPETRFIFLKAPDDGGKAYTDRVVTLLEKHLVEWSAKKGEQPVPILGNNLRRLHPGILTRVLDQVLGYAPAEQEDDEKN